MSAVPCRARISRNCEGDVRRADALEDGTYDERGDTVVCDACYVRAMSFSHSGRALRHELEDAILQARAGMSP